MSKVTVKQLLPVTDTWHVVVVEPECGGAALLRVAAWGIVSEEGKDDRVVPFVARIGDESSGALDYYREHEDDVLGIACPGQETGGYWDDVAAERKKAEEEEGRREEENAAFDAIVTKYRSNTDVHEGLRLLSKASEGYILEEVGPTLLVCLIENALVMFDGCSGSVNPLWRLTSLGRRVLAHLDKLTR